MKIAATYSVRGICIALVLVVVFAGAFWARYPPRYLTNDDVAIRLAIEGNAVPGQPATGFVLMTHSLLAWSLVWLRERLPTVPFWDLAVAATLLSAIAVLFTVTWTTLGTGWVARLTALIGTLVFVLPLVTDLQFTIGATLAGGVSVLLAATELTATRPRRAIVILSGVLLLAGLLTRPMGAAAGGVTAGLVLLPWAALGNRGVRRRLTIVGGALGVVASLSVGLIALDGLLYRADQSWHTYYRYNWMAADLAEWGSDLPADDVSAIRAAAGWTGNDWAMLQRWFAVDPALHGFEQVARAHEAREAAMAWDEWLGWTADQATAGSGSTLRHVAAESTLPLVVFATVFIVYARWRGRLAAVLGLVVFSGLCIVIETLFKDLPFRLLSPLQAIVTAAVFVIVGTQRREPTPAVAIVGLAVILTVATWEAQTVIGASERDRQHTDQVEREVRELLRLSPSLVVLHADAFPAEHWWRPFVEPPLAFDAISLTAVNPQLQDFLTRTARQPIFRAMCDDPSILVISEPDRLDLITIYLREHFKREVRWTPVYSASFRAWRCVG